MKLILHIGTEKTGTTSLQNFLYSNKEILYNSGYGISELMGERNNKRLVSYCLEEHRFNDSFLFSGIKSIKEKQLYDIETKNLFDQEIKGFKDIHTVILSSEHFHSRCTSLNEIKKLKQLLDPYFNEIKIIIYFRPQIDVAVSLYTTTLRSGGTLKFEDFLKQHCKVNNYYYNYSKILEYWATVFGRESISANIFEKNNLKNSNIIHDFLDQINFPLTDNLVMGKNLNESLLPMGQNILRLKNLYHDNLDHRFVKKCKAKVESTMLGKGYSPSKEIAYNIQSKFDSINKAVARDWFGKDQLFDIKYEKYNDGNAIEKAEENMLEFLFEEKVKSDKEIKRVLQALASSSTFNELHEKIHASSILVEILRELAVLFEKSGDINTAYQLMSQARSLRPNGPFLVQKAEQYFDLISKK